MVYSPPFSLNVTYLKFKNLYKLKYLILALFLQRVSRQYLDLLGLHPIAISRVRAAIRHLVFLVLSIYMFL